MPAGAHPDKRKALKRLSPKLLADMRALDEWHDNEAAAAHLLGLDELCEGAPRRELVYVGGGKMGHG